MKSSDQRHVVTFLIHSLHQNIAKQLSLSDLCGGSGIWDNYVKPGVIWCTGTEKRDSGENEDKERTKTHDNGRKGKRKRKRARLGDFCWPQCQ